MKYFSVVLSLAFALVFVSAQESSNEANAPNPVNPAFRGHAITFNENGSPQRKAGLEKVKQMLQKIGLKPIEQDNTQNREKRGALLGHHQPVVQHQPVVHHQPVQHYPQYYQYVEYCYEPQYAYDCY